MNRSDHFWGRSLVACSLACLLVTIAPAFADTVDGAILDLLLKSRKAEQGFAIVEIR
jgi:hypothetical protein